jgi:hypothetical protein
MFYKNKCLKQSCTLACLFAWIQYPSKDWKYFFYENSHDPGGRFMTGQDLTKDMIGTTSRVSGERSVWRTQTAIGWTPGPPGHPRMRYHPGTGRTENCLCFFYRYLMTKCVVKNVQDLINTDEIFQVGQLALLLIDKWHNVHCTKRFDWCVLYLSWSSLVR